MPITVHAHCDHCVTWELCNQQQKIVCCCEFSLRLHRYLRQQFRLLTRGPAGRAILDACLSSSAIDQTYSRSQFIRRFARGSDDPRDVSESNVSASLGHSVDEARTPSPRRVHFAGQRKASQQQVAMEKKLREIFDHYARQRAWQETAQMESTAWSHLLLDADRSHSSSAVLFDNQRLAPADADIVYSEAASRETARLRQHPSQDSSPSLGLATPSSNTGRTHRTPRRTDSKRRFTFEAFLVALKLLFVRRFGHTVADAGGGEDHAASSSRSEREAVVDLPVFTSLPQLLRHCLLTYILPLHKPLAAAARQQAQRPPSEETRSDPKRQQSRGRGGGPDSDRPVNVEDHLRYRPALHKLVQRFRSAYFAGDAEARAFLRQNETSLRSLFHCFSRSPADKFTASTSRTPGTVGGRSRSSSVQKPNEPAPSSLVASRVSAWKSMQREACRLSWAECRVFANTFGILRFVDVVELKAVFEECRLNSCVAAATSDPASTFVEEFGAHRRRRDEQFTEYVGYPDRNATGHAVAQHTTGAFVSPESLKKFRRGRQWSPSSGWDQTLLQDYPGMQNNDLEADSSLEGGVPAIVFPAFLDLVGMLALLVTERSGDCVGGDVQNAGHRQEHPHSSSGAPSAMEVLQLFFFRIYTSGGAREIVLGDLGLRAFFAAVDRSVRLLMQQRVRAQRLEQAAHHEANLQMMFDCMAE